MRQALLLALATVLAIACVAPETTRPTPTATESVTPSATPANVAPSGTAMTPTVSATEYAGTFGYTVRVPAGWRRSDLQSRAAPDPRGDPDILAGDTFTAQSPSEEAEAMRRSDTGIGPALEQTAHVWLYRNSRGLTAIAYAERQKGAFGNPVVSVEPTTVDGRSGARTTWKHTASDTRTFYELYVADGDRMWVVGFYLTRDPTAVRPAASDEAMRSIVESFRFR